MREFDWKVKIGRKHACRSAEAGLSDEADQLCCERRRSETDSSQGGSDT